MSAQTHFLLVVRVPSLHRRHYMSKKVYLVGMLVRDPMWVVLGCWKLRLGGRFLIDPSLHKKLNAVWACNF